MSFCFEKLLPLTSVQITRQLLIRYANGWVAIFNNARRGTNTSATGYLAEVLKTFAVAIGTVPEFCGQDKNARLPHAGALSFTLFGPDPTDFLNRVRSISLANEDGNWSFETEGIPLPFENELSYKSKKIRDRFNIELLTKYLLRMGIMAFEESFYLTSPAILLERSGSLNPLTKNYSIEEALCADGAAWQRHKVFG